jgi:hypothetical protein
MEQNQTRPQHTHFYADELSHNSRTAKETLVGEVVLMVNALEASSR